MKRFIMSMAALLFMIAGVEAQEVYNEIKAKAKATAEDVKADVVVRQKSVQGRRSRVSDAQNA